MKYANLIAVGAVNNSVFNEQDPVHVYAPTYSSRMLKNELKRYDIELNTPDINRGQLVDFEIYLEGQDITPAPVPKYLVAMENPYINDLNGNNLYCEQFSKVFSWNPAVTSGVNGITVLIPNEIKTDGHIPHFFERSIFSCLINANKRFSIAYENDLYKERLALIRWYEKNAPSLFGLFGRGWDKPGPALNFSERMTRSLKRLATKYFEYKPFPSYLGEVENKSLAYRQTKFAYCYENYKDLPNYITEKIFDAMMNGCVPIYWGANNISDYIPENCFIDRRSFESQSSLNDYLLGIDPESYGLYQENIANFLGGPLSAPFRGENFARRIASEIVAQVQLK